MITVRVHPNFLISHFVTGRCVAPLRVRAGIPEGCLLAACRLDADRGMVLMDFIDGKPERQEIEVVFDVLGPAPVGVP